MSETKSQLTSEKDLKFEFWAFDAYYTRYIYTVTKRKSNNIFFNGIKSCPLPIVLLSVRMQSHTSTNTRTHTHTCIMCWTWYTAR